MNISFKTFDYLSEESKEIRKAVFVDEQGFKDEFDESDNTAIHIVLYVDNKYVGNARIIFSKKHSTYVIGRVALLKEYRFMHLGSHLMEYAEQVICNKYGHILIGVGAQEKAVSFYEKLGYQRTEETYLEENCPHVWMIKQL